MRIWRNGEIVDAAGAVDATDRGVTLGDGLFETLALVGGAPLRSHKHVARLEAGAAVLGIPLEYDLEGITGAIRSLAAEAGVGEGAVRVTLLRGPGARGVAPPDAPSPTLLISATAGDVGSTAPLSVIVSKRTRRNEHSPLSNIKSTNYLDAVLARMEAAAAGADDAIMLNTAGDVAEGTAANVFCVIDGTPITPPVADGALPGIMRASVLAAAGGAERTLAPADLARASEVFLTSSLSVRPVVAIGGSPVGSGTPGPVAAGLGTLPRTAG